MKTIFKIPVLLLALMLVISCGDSKKEEAKTLLKSEFMSIEIPQGYDSLETNDPKELFILKKSMEDKGYVEFSISYIDDDVFSLITNEEYINNSISEESVSRWRKTLAEDLESYKHRQSVKYTFNSIGATLMRQDSFIQDDETVLFTLFQFVNDGKLFNCGAHSINTDKEYFDDYVEIMESIKF